MSSEDLTALLADAVDDPVLRERLLPLRGQDFAEALSWIAADRGLTVTPEDVAVAVRDARRTWWQRWV
jgi:hypothetical protein